MASLAPQSGADRPRYRGEFGAVGDMADEQRAHRSRDHRRRRRLPGTGEDNWVVPASIADIELVEIRLAVQGGRIGRSR